MKPGKVNKKEKQTKAQEIKPKQSNIKKAIKLISDIHLNTDIKLEELSLMLRK